MRKGRCGDCYWFADGRCYRFDQKTDGKKRAGYCLKEKKENENER